MSEAITGIGLRMVAGGSVQAMAWRPELMVLLSLSLSSSILVVKKRGMQFVLG
ncbi:hypothetical protein [Vibrio stylophorae]|uniref:hypothetical protein n=1 Tax=Vibrio stylophorae TaxID=659351 RepID=UPI001F3130AA|nr:hypothetical protein [Vibrio stylophorae]